jgi:hypothetical protein
MKGSYLSPSDKTEWRPSDDGGRTEGYSPKPKK